MTMIIGFILVERSCDCSCKLLTKHLCSTIILIVYISP